MSVSPLSKKLTWLLGLGLGLAGIGATAAPVMSQQPNSSAYVVKSRPSGVDPKESQKTIQQYRKVTAETPLDEEYNPVRANEARVAKKPAQPNYQRSPVANRTEPAGTIQQTGHHGHSHGQSVIDDPTIMPMGDSCDSCTSCGSGDCGGCLSDCMPCNYFSQNGFYVGGEYVNARATFSEPTAYLEQRIVVDANGNGTTFINSVPFDTNYQSTFRAYAGYRWGNCGEAINFSLFNFNDSNAKIAPPADPINGVIIAGPLEQNPNNLGQVLWTGLDTSITTYDLDYSKRIPICSCNSDPCSCCECPPWAVTWYAGVRVANIELNSPSILFDANGAIAADGNALVEFSGAGPKIGIEGRRFFGDCYRWSAYGKSNLSLLLGQYDVTLTKFTPAALQTSIQTYNFTRVVPVIDLEVGFSRQFGQNTLFTAGYFFQAYFDVSTINTVRFANFNTAAIDDANIMSFDGLMIRLEHTF